MGLTDRGTVERSEMALRMEPIGQLWAKVAGSRHEGMTRITRLELTTGCEPPGFQEHMWDYGDSLFLGTTLSGAQAASLIGAGSTEAAGEQLTVELADQAHYQRWPGAVSVEEPPVPWPYHQVTLNGKGGASRRSGLLVSRSAPSFLSEDDAMDAFFHGKKTGHPSRNADRFVLRFIDTRAYIQGIQVSPAGLEVTVGGHDTLGCRIEFSTMTESLSATVDTGNRVEFALPDGPPEEWWVVLSREDYWHDYRQYGPFGHSAGVTQVGGREELERLVFQGEGMTLEFKGELPPNGRDSRAMKTVCAFANSRGGTILFGVNDDGQVVGIGADYELARDRIANLINDAVSPRPSFDFRLLPHPAGDVIALVVDGDRTKGYSISRDKTPVFYIRRGATTVPAQGEDVRSLLRGPSTENIWRLRG